MSLKKGNTRGRLSLLAGSSLAAGLICLGGLAPPAATAATNPCGTDPSANGSAPDAITCPEGAYPTGIQHTSNGDLTVSIAKGADLGTGGSLTAAGQLTDDVTVTVTGADNWSGNEMPSPIMFDLESQQGDVSFGMATGNLQAGDAATTHAVRAISEQGGDVTVAVEEGIAAAGGDAGQVGVEARSHGGGDVTVRTAFGGQSRLYGVLASTDGAGALTINGGGGISGGATAPIAGIHATTGTGLMTITGLAQGQQGVGLFMNAGGNVNFTGGAISTATYGIDLQNVAGTTSTLNITLASSGALAAIRAQGGGQVIVNASARIDGTFDFSGLATTASINIQDGGMWRLSTSNTVGGNTIIATEGSGAIVLGQLTHSGANVPSPTFDVDAVTTVTFSGADNEIDNQGTFVSGYDDTGGYDRDDYESNVVLAGLERFRNGGTIILGGYVSATATDGWTDDILVLDGTDYIGEEGVLLMDVNLSAGPQSGCSDSLRGAADGLLPAADCVSIPGGSTSGVTYIRVNDQFAADRGGYNPEGVVLVEVAGGTSHAGDFLLDPASGGYSPLYGGVIDKNFFLYSLVYDEDAQQHKLITVAGENAMQFPILAQAATALWRTSTGTWFDRQADLRGGYEEGVGGGAWLRVAGETAERDTLQATEAVGTVYEFAGGYSQESYAVTGGVDLLKAESAEQAFVLGLMAGYANSKVEFEQNANSAQMNGWTGGLYASYLAGGLFVDAAVNAGKSKLDVDVPSLNIIPAGSLLRTHVLSVGAQFEGGWRFPLAQGVFVEPLAAASYVRTSSDVLEVKSPDASRPRIGVAFDDPVSLRAALGARLGLDQNYGPVRAQYSGLVRVWNEFEDETAVEISSSGPTTYVRDEFTGQFTELGLGASVSHMNGLVSGFLNLGGKFGDDYEAQTASAGVRVAW